VLAKFVVQGLPPKKDGANSMWRKPTEVQRLKALRQAARQAMPDGAMRNTPLRLQLCIHASMRDGDLDNFVTGVCDGLMAAHQNSPVTIADWQDVPDTIHPQHAIAFHDDAWIMQIVAARVVPQSAERFYEVQLASAEE